MRQIRSTRITRTRHRPDHRPDHPERPVEAAEVLAAFTGGNASLMAEVDALIAELDAEVEQLTARWLA